MLKTLGHLLETDGVVVEAQTVVAKALQEARDSAAGFSDLLIGHVALTNGANEVITFDKSFGRQPRVRRLT